MNYDYSSQLHFDVTHDDARLSLKGQFSQITTNYTFISARYINDITHMAENQLFISCLQATVTCCLILLHMNSLTLPVTPLLLSTQQEVGPHDMTCLTGAKSLYFFYYFLCFYEIEPTDK